MKNTFEKIKAYYAIHPKRFWVIGALLIIIIIVGVRSSTPEKPTLIPVAKIDLKKTVLATGQVTSKTDLDLSFSTGGLVRNLYVEVGDVVQRGARLASFDNRTEYAQLAEAQGGLKSAQANYQKVIDGSSNEEVAVAQANLESAQVSLDSVMKTQDTLVTNAHRAVLNADLTPSLSSGLSSTPPIVSGTYTGDTEGVYHISIYDVTNGAQFSYSGIESGVGRVNTDAPSVLGTKGLYIQFSKTTASTSVWDVVLPNTKSLQYLNEYAGYQNSLKNRDSAVSAAQASVNEARANLNLKKAAARPADVSAAEAAVVTAQAKVDSAQATYDNTILRAPSDGTIVRVDTKIGERVESQREVMVLQDVTNLYVEADINETNIAKVSLGQPVTMTLDAFGPTVPFTGVVSHIDPSSTTTDGIANYVIKASIVSPDKMYVVRPGMNANMTIIAADIPGVIAIPKAAVVTNPDGTTSVNVITNPKRLKYTARPVTLGFEGDGNMVEVKSGLAEGDSLALVKAK